MQNKLIIFWFTLHQDFSPVSANGAGPLPLSRATKEAKRSFSYRSERTKNHRDLFMCLFSVGTKGSDRSIVALSFSDFFISASWMLFSAHLYLKPLSIQFTATLLLSLSLSSSDTRCYRYSLPSHCPTVDSRWLGCFDWLLRGWFAWLTKLFTLRWGGGSIDEAEASSQGRATGSPLQIALAI